MTRTKTKTRTENAPSKKATRSSDSVSTEFADASEVPGAQTVAELKAAAKTPHTSTSSSKVSTTKNAKAGEWSIAERLRFKWGMGGVRTLSIIIRAVLFGMLAIVVWVTALTIASGLVPAVAQLVSDGTGVTFESRLDHVIMGLLLPTLFLNGLLFVLVCVTVKKLWKLHLRLGTRARNVLLGEGQ